MPYDLYGTYYASARDAENAEMAQCAMIDASYANERIEYLERQLSAQPEPSQNDHEINELQLRVKSLEERIALLEQALLDMNYAKTK